MSRYNSIGVEVKGWLFVFTIPFWALAITVAYLIHDDAEEAEKAVFRTLVCPLTGHRWADEEKYGVRSVCLDCGTDRSE